MTQDTSEHIGLIVIRISEVMIMSEYIFEITKDADGVYCYIKQGELVRCKDCVWRDGSSCRINDTMPWSDDDYCSNGERADK